LIETHNLEIDEKNMKYFAAVTARLRSVFLSFSLSQNSYFGETIKRQSFASMETAAAPIKKGRIY
jgi:hypothetical protein